MKLTKARLKQIIKEEVAAETEEEDSLKGFGTGTTTKSAQARSGIERSKAIAKGDTLGGIDNKERDMLLRIEKALTSIADRDNLIKYRSVVQTVLQKLLAASGKVAGKGS
jgi:hypothetical protein